MKHVHSHVIRTHVRPVFKFLFILYCFLSGPKVISATIYIDPNYQDSIQNGSQSRPYDSWSKVNILSGNTYLQKSGTTASSGQIAFTGKSNITFGAYGTGSKPKIITSGSGNGIFYITNSYNISIRDLEITSSGNWNAAIIIQGNSSSNNLISNCWIHRLNWGIRILTTAAGTRILYSRINDIKDDGIFAQSVRSIEIAYCNIYDINKKYLTNPSESYAAGDGIQINSDNNLTFNVHHNTVDHSSMGNKFCFYVWGNNYKGTLEHNTFIASSSKQSNGVYLNNSSNTILLRYNTFKNANYGIIVNASKADVYYNCFISNRVGIMVNPGFALNARNNVFFNNTKYGISSSYNTSLTLKNNIFNLSSSPAKAFYFMGGISSNHNVFNTQYSGFINGYSSLNSWKNNTGNDLNSVVGNPSFMNAYGGDFHIQSGSVAINKGQNVNLIKDYFGNNVPLNGNPDIGIHEFGGTKSTELSLIEFADSDSTGSVTESDTTTSFSEVLQEVLVYPNPSPNGIFNLQFGIVSGRVNLMVFDVTGNRLQDLAVINPEMETLNLSGFQPGVYFLKTEIKGNIQTVKLIIK